MKPLADIDSGRKVLVRKSGLAWLIVALLLPILNHAQAPDPVETIRVDSDLVDLKVSVFNSNREPKLAALDQSNFLVLENGQPQTISFFATAETPFDLVLLIDLSGSTRDKLKLVRASAQAFVDSTRDTDRVSVVTFTDRPLLACPLTLDRKLLKDSIDDIKKPAGGTNFWDSLARVLGTLRSPQNASRRNAVVVMTDGVDNALPDVTGEGSRIHFEDLLAMVRKSETLVFPIYLDTEEEESKRHRTPRSAFALAREQLAQLAEASGTQLYRAKKLKDLDDAYAQVISDLGHVYTIGYSPTNSLRDGQWRSVNVQILNRGDVRARTKPGYYAARLPDK